MPRLGLASAGRQQVAGDLWGARSTIRPEGVHMTDDYDPDDKFTWREGDLDWKPSGSGIPLTPPPDEKRAPEPKEWPLGVGRPPT
jgi:hypothetical protein